MDRDRTERNPGHDRAVVSRMRLARPASVVAVLLLVGACSGGGPAEPDGATSAPGSSAVTTSDAGAEVGAGDRLAALPVRDGPRRETTHGVPHVQLDAEPVPEVDAELRRRAFALPGVENRESRISLPGARSLWLADDVELARPEVLQAGREFAHIHPNGSLHVWLPVERAIEVAETKWGELHPWVGRDDFWDGLVLVYTPETLDEVDITMELIVDAYNHVTGAELDPAAFE